ncbi:Programmed cell death 6-interacting protein [Amphibalanus amphitrite]|uniref:Programmed cell death 6-interacting protein n=1 Tax=Amphibalanus amphitrite TaxID=1232801 RepID=A0A6A4W4A2_AMPAM|nr:Programmed cell death 6-interacting protein [Amphibalanus amphitrite]
MRASAAESAAMDFIAVPIKRTSEQDLVRPLKSIIASSYSTADNPADYADAIQDMNKLRASATWKSFDKTESALEVLYRYYDQLLATEAKIPAQEVTIYFKWKDAFDKGSWLSGRQSLTPAKMLQHAASNFNHLKTGVMSAIHQEPTPDLNPETLAALSQLMQAQAQEAFVLKAIRDQMKEAIIAKLCAQCDDYYSESLKAMQRESGEESGLAEYYQSRVCNANKAVGEEIARLQHAESLIRSSATRAGDVPAWGVYAARAQQALASAKKDNDFIYHERVPDVKALAPIGKAAIAKLLPAPEHYSKDFRDLFAQLTPVPVQQAMAGYEVRKTELVNTEVGRLREATQTLNGVLASLNLPAALEDTSGTALPSSIREKAAHDSVVRAKFDANRAGIELLSKSESELAAATPQGHSSVDGGSPAAQRLKALMERVETIKSDRDVLECQLKRTVPSARRPVSEETLATTYGHLRTAAAESLAAQEKLLAEIQEANTEFVKQRGSGGSQRETMFKDLATAHDVFTELRGNLKEGMKFYNDLTQLLLTFQNKVSDFCFARKTEKEELMKDMTSTLANQQAGSAPKAPETPTPAARQPPPRPPPPTTSPTSSSSAGGSSAPPADPAPNPYAGAPPGAMPYPSQPSHDDRASRGTSYRQADFKARGRMRRGQGRYQGNLDDDAEMGGRRPRMQQGDDRRRGMRGRGRPRPSRGRGRGLPPGGGGRNPPNASQPSWFRVIVKNGQTFGKEFVMNAINENLPEPYMPIGYTNEANRNDVHFFVENKMTADTISALDGRILAPNGSKMKIMSRRSEPPMLTVDDAVKAELAQALSNRYVPANRTLNLSQFYMDPYIRGKGLYLPLNRQNVVAAVLEIITGQIPEVVGINLSKNRITSLMPFKAIKSSLKDLKALDLSHNSLGAITHLDSVQGMALIELNLDGNHLCDSFKEKAEYISAVRKRFPKVILLDNVELPPPIEFDVEDDAAAVTKLPESKSSYFCGTQPRDIALMFLKQYFDVFDADKRDPLMDAYHDNCRFSLSVSLGHRNSNER